MWRQRSRLEVRPVQAARLNQQKLWCHWMQWAGSHMAGRQRILRIERVVFNGLQKNGYQVERCQFQRTSMVSVAKEKKVFMSDSMNDFMESIYGRIGKGSEEVAGEPSTGRHDERILMRRMADASCSAKITGSCGETMEIYLKVGEEQIVDASFVADGCGFSVLCGYIATQLAKHKTMDEAVQIGGDTILSAFREIPEDHKHCAYLAAEALHAAIHQWMIG